MNVNPKIGPTCPKCAGLVVDEECQNCGTKCATSDVKEGNITELSKRTLGNYVKDASSDAAMKSMDHGNKPLAKDAPKREKKILNRLSGIRKATDKLSKEEVEHLVVDEGIGDMAIKAIEKTNPPYISKRSDMMRKIKLKQLKSYLKKQDDKKKSASKD